MPYSLGTLQATGGKTTRHWDGFQVLTAVTMKCNIFVDVMHSSLTELHRRFEGTYFLRQQGRKVREVTGKKHVARIVSSLVLLLVSLSLRP
jgi:hypothetical protein